MNSVILIPARYASSRFPGKPLVRLRGASGAEKPLIQRSFEAAVKVRGPSAVFVTTDDDRIASACAEFGAPVIRTSSDCRNGTMRCAEAVQHVGDPNLVINFQGDALLTPPAYVEALLSALERDRNAQVATPAIRLSSDEVRQLQAAERQALVGGTTVVTGRRGRALYFSKRLIPYLPPGTLDRELSPVRLHIGVYAYRSEALRHYAANAETDLECLEGLEQLRFLDLGIPVGVVEVEPPSFRLSELNNPEDVTPIEAALAQLGID